MTWPAAGGPRDCRWLRRESGTRPIAGGRHRMAVLPEQSADTTTSAITENSTSMAIFHSDGESANSPKAAPRFSRWVRRKKPRDDLDAVMQRDLPRDRQLRSPGREPRRTARSGSDICAWLVDQLISQYLVRAVFEFFEHRAATFANRRILLDLRPHGSSNSSSARISFLRLC